MNNSILYDLDSLTVERDYIFHENSDLIMPIKSVDIVTLSVDVKQLNGRADKRQSLAIKGCFVPGSIFAPDVVAEEGTIRTTGIFLIDTGADHCAINQQVVTQLKLRKYGNRESIGINKKSEIKPLYKVQISLSDIGLLMPLEKVVSTNSLGGYGNYCIGIIGRDVLAYCQLHYNGVTGEGYLEYDDSVPITPIL